MWRLIVPGSSDSFLGKWRPRRIVSRSVGTFGGLWSLTARRRPQFGRLNHAPALMAGVGPAGHLGFDFSMRIPGAGHSALLLLVRGRSGGSRPVLALFMLRRRRVLDGGFGRFGGGFRSQDFGAGGGAGDGGGRQGGIVSSRERR